MRLQARLRHLPLELERVLVPLLVQEQALASALEPGLVQGQVAVRVLALVASGLGRA